MSRLNLTQLSEVFDIEYLSTTKDVNSVLISFEQLITPFNSIEFEASEKHTKLKTIAKKYAKPFIQLSTSILKVLGRYNWNEFSDNEKCSQIQQVS